ncbi:MAG: DNA-3-methyladenine glycosylase family protein [Burkholderiaceae bacterium]|jgi:DNA-3-methyladenine glycosylase II
MEAAQAFVHTDDPDAPAYWDEACALLACQHPVWRELISRYRDRALRTRGDAFQTLARAIVGQQISVKAADAVWGRFAQIFSIGVNPAAVLGTDVPSQRAAGLSGRKVEYMQSLARFAQAGGLDTAMLAALDDEDCLLHLGQIHGIGRWTAEMFLIFNLRRPDVWPVDDIGLLKALGRSFLDGRTPDAREARVLGEAFRPWRTIAAWYLWRSLDPIAVDY